MHPYRKKRHDIPFDCNYLAGTMTIICQVPQAVMRSTSCHSNSEKPENGPIAFMCFEVNSHANKPYCHFSDHFVTFLSLIPTIAKPLLNIFHQDDLLPHATRDTLHELHTPQDLPVQNDSLGSMPAQ